MSDSKKYVVTHVESSDVVVGDVEKKSDDIEVVDEIKEDVGKTGFISETKWIDSDGIGYIELIDYMGSDLTSVNSARVSFNKFTEKISERDERLIKYLANHNHISVFFHAQLQFRIKMPLFSARQWFKHSVGQFVSNNECSGRYVTIDKEFWIPQASEIRAKADNVKQGSASHPPEKAEEAHNIFKESVEASLKAYDKLIELGMCTEQARSILPQGTYTYFISTMSLYAAFRIYKLRTESTAQKEIQLFAQALGAIAEKKFPINWKALKDAHGIE
jgi:thymidylate synthase (FAD)